MTTVREAAFELLRGRSMTTLFGNPGSTELPMLTEFPEDFRYVLGLQEATVVGLADGYAQASGRPTLVNLHTAPGVGNAMGAIFNAQANKSPLVITAGQQYRSLMTLQANLTNREAIRMPHPLVKWSYEPPRAQDVPHALARAIHIASLPPRGPSFLSIPMDDWGAEVDDGAVAHQSSRTVAGAGQPGPQALAALAERLRSAERPALVAGPEIDASGGWEAAIRLAELQRLPVYATPAPGGGRMGFPESHPLFQGILPPAVLPVGEMLAAHDFVLTVGTSVFPYYPNIPGPLLAEGTALVAITSDPDEAARAPMGDAILADPALTLAALADTIGESDREAPPTRPAPEPAPAGDPMSPSTAVRALAEVFPEDGIVVLESPSATLALRNQLRLSRPGSYYFSSGGGLGFGMPAAIGVQLAQPSRPVVCVIGEGSAQYAIQSLWTAAAYDVPVTFLVLRNDEYAILKWFGMLEDIVGAPGLDLPSLDCAAVASGYGVHSQLAGSVEELGGALGTALGSGKPELVEVKVAPGMALA
ncbi:MAG TPA: benzoylformate decarboxylase [Solirubrobacteraceae bacterium]|nr:benzoylformate decarboxylase [Solirubrobacteraceae bacterium]